MTVLARAIGYAKSAFKRGCRTALTEIYFCLISTVKWNHANWKSCSANFDRKNVDK